MGFLKRSVVLCVIAPDTQEFAQAIETAYSLQLVDGGAGRGPQEPSSPTFTTAMKDMRPFTSMTWIRSRQEIAPVPSTSTSPPPSPKGRRLGPGGLPLATSPLAEQLDKVVAPTLLKSVDVVIPLSAMQTAAVDLANASLSSLPDPLVVVNDPMKRVEVQMPPAPTSPSAGALSNSTNGQMGFFPPTTNESFALCVVCDKQLLLPFFGGGIGHGNMMGVLGSSMTTAPTAPAAAVTAPQPRLNESTSTPSQPSTPLAQNSGTPILGAPSGVPGGASSTRSSSSANSGSSPVLLLQLPQSESVIDISAGSRDAFVADVAADLPASLRLQLLISAVQRVSQKASGASISPSTAVSWRSTLRPVFNALVKEFRETGSVPTISPSTSATFAPAQLPPTSLQDAAPVTEQPKGTSPKPRPAPTAPDPEASPSVSPRVDNRQRPQTGRNRSFAGLSFAAMAAAAIVAAVAVGNVARRWRSIPPAAS